LSIRLNFARQLRARFTSTFFW